MSPDLLREPPAKGTGGSDGVWEVSEPTAVLAGFLKGGGGGKVEKCGEHCERRTCLGVLYWAECPYVSPLPQVSREIPEWCRPR